MRSARKPCRADFATAKAFTILELLVAGTITAALAGFLVVLVANVGGIWTRASNRLSADAQARYILDQLTLDLQGAQFRDDGNVWFAVDVLNNATGNATGLWQTAAANAKPVGGTSLAMNSANLADARFGTAGVWLRFFTTRRGANDATSAATTVSTTSAPVAVGYQIIRRFTAATAAGTAATSTGYLLHRAEARPAATGAGAAVRPGVLESGYNIRAAAYTTSTVTNNNGATVGDPRSIQVPGSARDLSSVIGFNVVDFGVRCYVRDSTKPGGLRLIFPATDETGNALSNSATARVFSSLPAGIPATSTNFNQVFPEVVEVMLRVLTDEGARLIALFEQSNSPLALPNGVNAQQYWWQLATANSYVFTRRIVLRTQPL
jgi:hypothetical protein